MRLYSYYRSSAAYRVRIALALKGVPYEYEAVNLLQGDHRLPAYAGIDPAQRVPALEVADGAVLNQSVAILEWLEETHPDPALLPGDPLARARVRSVVNLIACDVHPLCNVSALAYLREHFAADEHAIAQWYAGWVRRGLSAVEVLIADRSGPFAFGDHPTLADVCLVPQVFNARRFDVALDDFPAICAVDDHCAGLEAFSASAPEQQPDAP